MHKHAFVYESLRTTTHPKGRKHQAATEGIMLELSGTVELVVVEVETQQEERFVVTAKDFDIEKRSMLDDDVMREDEDGEYIAYLSALGFDFRLVASPPNNLEIEDDPEEIRVEIVENNIDFIEASGEDEVLA